MTWTEFKSEQDGETYRVDFIPAFVSHLSDSYGALPSKSSKDRIILCLKTQRGWSSAIYFYVADQKINWAYGSAYWGALGVPKKIPADLMDFCARWLKIRSFQ